MTCHHQVMKRVFSSIWLFFPFLLNLWSKSSSSHILCENNICSEKRHQKVVFLTRASGSEPLNVKNFHSSSSLLIFSFLISFFFLSSSLLFSHLISLFTFLFLVLLLSFWCREEPLIDGHEKRRKRRNSFEQFLLCCNYLYTWKSKKELFTLSNV